MGPLSGLRIVELASIGPGPMCAMLLADLGADVIRVDRLEPSNLGVDMAAKFDVCARNRRSIALDLKRAEGRAAVLKLVERADVLVEGFRPGVAERLGLGPVECHQRNPRLVYARMTGFGQDGPLAQSAGHDLNYISLTGALHAIGTKDRPLPPLNLIGDYGGGALYLALGILAALFERNGSGKGQVVDAAMTEGAASLMSIFYGLFAGGSWQTRRESNLLDGGAPFYGVYETKDGLHVSIAALENKFFAELAQKIGLDARFVKGQMDRTLWPDMRTQITGIIKQKTRAEWCAVLEGTDACFAPVLSMQEAPSHAHNAARGAFVTLNGFAQPAPAPRFSRSKPDAPKPPPEIGAHTRAVLEEAGYGAAEIDALKAAGAVG